MLSMKRKVRSSGRTSGSIEITLPPEMHTLEGIECRLMLCDGVRPEIVIRPDVSIAEVVFADLWERLRIAFTQIGDIGPSPSPTLRFPFCHRVIGMSDHRFPTAVTLAIYRVNQDQFNPDNSGLSHVITFLTVNAAYRLGLQNRYALVFGVIVGHLVSGMNASHGSDFEQDAILHLFDSYEGSAYNGLAQAPLSMLFDMERWEEAQAGFKHIYNQVWAWQIDPTSYELAAANHGTVSQSGTTQTRAYIHHPKPNKEKSAYECHRKCH